MVRGQCRAADGVRTCGTGGTGHGPWSYREQILPKNPQNRGLAGGMQVSGRVVPSAQSLCCPGGSECQCRVLLPSLCPGLLRRQSPTEHLASEICSSSFELNVEMPAAESKQAHPGTQTAELKPRAGQDFSGTSLAGR